MESMDKRYRDVLNRRDSVEIFENKKVANKSRI
jgi:hypothetical protein